MSVWTAGLGEGAGALAILWGLETRLSIVMPPFNPTTLRKTKIVCNFGLSECKRVEVI